MELQSVYILMSIRVAIFLWDNILLQPSGLAGVLFHYLSG